MSTYLPTGDSGDLSVMFNVEPENPGFHFSFFVFREARNSTPASRLPQMTRDSVHGPTTHNSQTLH
jgi:hypothetical protein